MDYNGPASRCAISVAPFNLRSTNGRAKANDEPLRHAPVAQVPKAVSKIHYQVRPEEGRHLGIFRNMKTGEEADGQSLDIATTRKALGTNQGPIFIPGEIGAGGGNRTHTPVKVADFKSAASTVPPPRHYRACPIELALSSLIVVRAMLLLELGREGVRRIWRPALWPD